MTNRANLEHWILQCCLQRSALRLFCLSVVNLSPMFKKFSENGSLAIRKTSLDFGTDPMLPLDFFFFCIISGACKYFLCPPDGRGLHSMGMIN